MKKISTTANMKKWTVLLQEADSSGLSRNAWCEKEGVSKRQFYYWRKKVRGQEATPGRNDQEPKLEADGSETEDTVFFELPMLQPRQHSPENQPDLMPAPFVPEAVLQYGQARILVGRNISEETLSTILSAIRHV